MRQRGSGGDPEIGTGTHSAAGTTTATPATHVSVHGPGYYVALALGWAVIGYALHGFLASPGAPAVGVFRLLIGLNIVNDAVVVPVALLLGLAVRRLVPGWLRAPVQVGLFASAVVTAYAYPLVAAYGHTHRAGPSRLPWDYAHNLAVVLGVLWLACAIVAVISWRRTLPAR